MEQEYHFTGYCRRLDAPRIVEVIRENGENTDIDCDFHSCPHKESCPIAQQIGEL